MEGTSVTIGIILIHIFRINLFFLFPVCRGPDSHITREPIDIKIIVLAIVASIVLIGLALLLVLRLAIYLQDRQEFARFEKERKKAHWDEVSYTLKTIGSNLTQCSVSL